MNETKSPNLPKCGRLSISPTKLRSVVFYDDFTHAGWAFKLVSLKIVGVNYHLSPSGHIVGFNCTRHIMSAHAPQPKSAQHAPSLLLLFLLLLPYPKLHVVKRLSNVGCTLHFALCKLKIRTRYHFSGATG